jgi:hypothetical protein
LVAELTPTPSNRGASCSVHLMEQRTCSTWNVLVCIGICLDLTNVHTFRFIMNKIYRDCINSNQNKDMLNIR